MESVQRNHFNHMETKDFHTLGRFVQRHWNQLAQENETSEEILHTLFLPALTVIGSFISVRPQKNLGYLGPPYESTLIYENAGLKIECLELGASGCIPAHDHPGSIGINHLLYGTAMLIQADQSRPECLRKQQLNAGDTCFTYPDRNNIHGFRTGASEATLISINIHKETGSHDLKRWHLITDLVAEITARPKIPVRNAIMLFFLSSIAQPASAAECIMSKAQQELLRENYQRAALILEDCADKGLRHAQRKMGDLYLSGRGVEKDPYTAAQWYRKAALQGDIQAQYSYGIMLLDGNGITEDNIEGFDWIYEAARSGHARAKEVYEYIQANPAPLEC